MGKGKRDKGSPTSPKSTVVDLGLSSLIESAKVVKAEIPQPLTPTIESSEIKVEKVEQPAIELSEYEKLSSADEWGKLEALCEARMPREGSDEDPEVTLWWIACQKKKGSVPSLVLAAPLDSATKAILKAKADSSIDSKKLASLEKVSLRLLISSSNALKDQGERELSLKFLERATELDPKHKKALLKQASEEQEALAKVRTRKEKAAAEERLAYIEGLKKRFSAAETVSKSEGKAELKKENTVESAAQPEIVKLEQSARFSRRKLTLTVGALAAFALAIILTSTWSESSMIGKEELAGAFRLPAEIQYGMAEAAAPESRRIQTLSDLDAIYYGIDNAQVAVRTVSATTTQARESVSASRAVRKEELDMSGPIEGEVFKYPRSPERGRLEMAASDSRTAYPTDAPRQAGGDQVDAMRSARNERSQRYEHEAQYELKKFSRNRVYRILVSTEVKERPSIRADEIANLDRGAKVEVDAKIGDWLRLRSKKGNPGFVLAQDAVDTGEDVGVR